MCGRYASSRRPEDLIEEFEVVDSRVPEPLAPDYNVAPTKEVYAVVERPSSKEAGDAGEPPARQLRVVKWGLVPSWAKDASIGNRMINARMETVAEKPAYKRALAVRRCLLPADGYFEWYPTDEKTKARQAEEAALLHPPQGRRPARDGRPLRDLARPDQGRRRRRPVPLDLHGDHHRRPGRPRQDPRPDAAHGRARPVGRLAGPPHRQGLGARPAGAGRTGPTRGLPRLDHGQRGEEQRPRAASSRSTSHDATCAASTRRTARPGSTYAGRGRRS